MISERKIHVMPIKDNDSNDSNDAKAEEKRKRS